VASYLTVFTDSRADSEVDSGAVWMSVFSVCRKNLLAFLCLELLGVKMTDNLTKSLYI